MRIKNQEDIIKIRKGAKILAAFLNSLKTKLKVGMTLIEIDQLAEDYIRTRNGIPAFKNFKGFPATVCASVNEDIIHGIPNQYALKDGDIISIDIGIIYENRFADTAYTYVIGSVEKPILNLVQHTQESLYAGINQVIAGARVGDISHAVEFYAKKYKYGIVRDYSGHGVGFQLWEEPSIPNYGKKGLGPRLLENMVIAIEPMFNLGSDDVILKSDGWTVTTKDGLKSAHFEHTVWVKKDGFEILTSLD